MTDRFFVEIRAERSALGRLADAGLDLFARTDDASGSSIHGLVTLDDIGRLARDGYRVVVTATDEGADQLIGVTFEAWIADTMADLDEYLVRGE